MDRHVKFYYGYFKALSQNYEKRLLASYLSIRLSVRPYGTARHPLDGFS